MMKTKSPQSTSTRSDYLTSSATVAVKAKRSRNHLKSSENQEAILSSPFKTSTITSKRLMEQRYTNWLGMLNLKFGHNSVAKSVSKGKSELLPDVFASVYGTAGEWKISSTINKDWWELYEHPHKGAIYAVLWITPFVGIILDQCAKSEDRLLKMLWRLDELASLFRAASKSMIDPEHIESINPPTAGAGTRRSIQQLFHEAKFLQKDISGAEVIDRITRTRSLVERAARIHQDTLPQIFAAARRTAEFRKQQNEKSERTLHGAENKVPARKPKVSGARVQPAINASPSPKRSRRQPQQG